MAEKLRSGYTTGTHATATLVACFYEYFEQKIVDTLKVVLPKEIVANIEVTREEPFHFSSIKGDNDDIDVTKGAKISCQFLKNIPQDLQEQTPSIIPFKHLKLHIWAGRGVGFVTKKGLKIRPNHPAINPVPLEMMQENIVTLIGESEGEFHAVFSVENGEKIAKETANAKVGVIGGISILGTRGIVKPVSSSAYIDSIETEIDVAAAFDESVVVFTLGNTAVDFAKEHYNETSIVEIGNFIYDASERLNNHNFKRLVFITSVAKMTKVAQGFKNTHNKFGTIDFDEVREWIQNGLDFDLGTEEFVTLKGVLQTLPKEYHNRFVQLMTQKSVEQFRRWFLKLDVGVQEIELITLPQKIRCSIKMK
jgi:cobalt-precorrin-5B (C1)-methyltransferase